MYMMIPLLLPALILVLLFRFRSEVGEIVGSLASRATFSSLRTSTAVLAILISGFETSNHLLLVSTAVPIVTLEAAHQKQYQKVLDDVMNGVPEAVLEADNAELARLGAPLGRISNIVGDLVK